MPDSTSKIHPALTGREPGEVLEVLLILRVPHVAVPAAPRTEIVRLRREAFETVAGRVKEAVERAGGEVDVLVDERTGRVDLGVWLTSTMHAFLPAEMAPAIAELPDVEYVDVNPKIERVID